MIIHLSDSNNSGGMIPAAPTQNNISSPEHIPANKAKFNVVSFNEIFLDGINTIAVGSNTIILCFWVHSKYDLKSSTDKSSLIVNDSSIIVIIFYLLTIIIGYFIFYDYTTESMSKFLLFNDIYYYEFNRKIHVLKIIYQIINSLSFLIMINFYFMVIKEVILRKNLVRFFRGKL